VRQRWLSRRAVLLHLAVVVWCPTCLFAGWWQVTRALGGNGLSYLYSVEWPIFALVGVWGWWMLIHIDPATVGRPAQLRLEAEAAARAAPAGAVGGAPTVAATAPRRPEEEDEALAAYNDHLAQLAQGGPQTWRHR
jgi:hypothetical protein